MMKMSYESFWEMSPREFFSAWYGYDEQLKTEWDVAYWISKLNALRTTWSQKQANQIQRDLPPWDKSGKKSKQMSKKQIGLMLDLISG